MQTNFGDYTLALRLHCRLHGRVPLLTCGESTLVRDWGQEAPVLILPRQKTGMPLLLLTCRSSFGLKHRSIHKTTVPPSWRNSAQCVFGGAGCILLLGPTAPVAGKQKAPVPLRNTLTRVPLYSSSSFWILTSGLRPGRFKERGLSYRCCDAP